jgi:hypothetical protein
MYRKGHKVNQIVAEAGSGSGAGSTNLTES